MPAALIKILLVEDDPTDAMLIGEHLKRASDFGHELEHASTMAEALTQLQEQQYQVCLLDLNLPDSSGIEAIQKIVAAAPQLPVVVITNLKEKSIALAAVKSGAQDYLIKTELGPHQLSTALLLAMERKKTLAGEYKTLASFPFYTKAATTSLIYGQGPLKDTHPEAVRELAEIYAKAMSETVELTPYGEKPNNHQALLEMAEHLGRLNAGPKDLVEIHTEAFKNLSQGATLQKIEALTKEGRLTLVQVMGYLAAYYRKYCRSLPGIRDGNDDTSTGHGQDQEG